MKDIKPVFDCATQHGDVKVVGRILLKIVPVMLQHQLQITETMIKNSESLEVPDAVYDAALKVVNDLVKDACADDGASNDV